RSGTRGQARRPSFETGRARGAHWRTRRGRRRGAGVGRRRSARDSRRSGQCARNRHLAPGPRRRHAARWRPREDGLCAAHRSNDGGEIVNEPPLAGLTILDLSRVLSGPYCTMLAADMGARVIQIEHPERGDDTRAWGPPFLAGESAYYLSINRNKESVAIDFKT